jgi:hypothetical protein
MLQKINIEGKEYTLFFDTGCSDMVARYDAVVRIGTRAKQEVQTTASYLATISLHPVSKNKVYSLPSMFIFCSI